MTAGPINVAMTDRGQRAAIGVGVAGLLLFGLGTLINRSDLAAVLRSYLVAWSFWFGIALGSLGILLLHYVAGGAWGTVLRVPLEAAGQTMLLMAVLFIPIAIGMPQLYSWVNSRDPHLAEKQAYYLNVPFFLVRATGYFAVWFVLVYLLGRWSDQQSDPDEVRRLHRLRFLSAPGLVLYGLTVTFAAIDWVMSLEPHWYSSIYGLLFGMGQALSAFAFATAVTIVLADRPPFRGMLSPERLRDLGSLLLAFVMLWAYLSFSQLLLIWSGNLSEEIPWYLRRLRGGWQWVGIALILFQFVLPFLLLLSADVKRSRRPLLAVACLVLVMHGLDLFWMIAPAHDELESPGHSGLAIHGWDAALSLCAGAGIGGFWLAFFVWRLRERIAATREGAGAPEATTHG